MDQAREPLNRDRVARAALGFIDEHGEAGLSMRKLGAELGVEAMSLYNHVHNKDDLLNAVADLLYDEVLEGLSQQPSMAWQDELREVAHVYRAVAHGHPHALGLMVDRVVPSAVRYQFLGACYSIFTRAGFDTKNAAAAFDTSASWVVGAIRQELGLMAELEERGPGFGAEELPSELRDVVDFTTACVAWTPNQRFDYGLETLIAGLEWRLAGG